MLNRNKSKFKNIFCCIILCLGVMLSAFANFTLSLPSNKEVYASSYNNIRKDVSSELLSTYYNFYTTSTNKPATASGWSEISDSAVNKDNMIKGIVDLENETTFNTTTYKTTKPSMPKDKSSDKAYFKNLMINSHNGAGRLGYKSNSISLEANSFYSISVKLYTHRTTKTDSTEETDPTASIYLTGLTTDEKYDEIVKFENINTLTSWEEYTFYIDTDASASVNLELWLGSKTTNVQGAVFFNYVKIIRYSEDYYRENITTESNKLLDTDENNFNIIELSKNATEPVANSSFETTTPMLWDKIAQSTTGSNGNDQRCEIVDINNFSYTTNNKTIKALGSNCSANNSHALFMYNKNNGYQALESTEFTIEQLGYYRVTFWAKSDCNTGSGATVYLVDKSESNPITNSTLTLATSYTANSNVYRNDWTKYSFYIYGDNLEDKQVSIQIWLGTKTAQTTGYVFIDDFRLEEIDYSTYSSNSSSSNCTTMNFNNDTDNFVVSNSTFDKTQNANNEREFPLTPANWTASKSDNNTIFSGVINTDPTHFENNISNYSSGSLVPSRPTALPYTTNENNNVLMMGSSSESNSQTYSSNNLTLSANSYYKLSFYTFTDYRKIDMEDNLGARVKVTASSRTLFDYYNIYYNDNEWHKFEIYFKTGPYEEVATLELKFDNLTGYVFFDEIMLETSNETTYASHYEQPGVNCFHIDLSYENFDNKTFNMFADIQIPNNWTGSEQDGLTVNESGIIKANDTRISEFSAPLSNNENVLYISSLHDVNYSFVGKVNYSFKVDTYYRVSVNVLTANIIPENGSDDINYGASIGLNKSQDIFFSGINTNGVWKTYTMYICLGEELVSPIQLSLGAKDEKTSGLALFDNLKVETIDKETFDEEIKTTDNDLTACFINYTETTTPEAEKSTWTNNFDWLILPSLITAITIIIAVVGFYVRKISFNKKPKIKTKYDRRKTLDKDIDRREKIALRQQIIDELNEELQAIDKEIEQFQKLAEQQLEEIKQQILAEKEEIERKKIEIEIRKKEAQAERNKQLKENPELVSNTKAEKDFEKFITKLDKQEMALQKQIIEKDVKIANTQEADKSRLAKYLERKEFIKNEIAKIEAEIEAIAKEEADMWEEYRLAKQEAKKRKAEYKAQLKYEKEQKKKAQAKLTENKPYAKTQDLSKSEDLKLEEITSKKEETTKNEVVEKKAKQTKKEPKAIVSKENKSSTTKKSSPAKKTTTTAKKTTRQKTTSKKAVTNKKEEK